MARTVITPTDQTRAGIAPSAGQNADMTNGMVVNNNDGRIWFEIISTDAGSQYVDFEIPTPATVTDGQAVTPRRVTVPAGATRKTAAWPTAIFNQANKDLNINPSINGATLKIAAYRLPPG